MQALINDFEFEFLQTLSDPIRTVQTMLLTKLLSAHAKDEVYLCNNTEWILVHTLLPSVPLVLSCVTLKKLFVCP